ncbi:MAG: phage tail sheath protein [Oscillospiraceae bacterium]|nr:phage tail sheath protein [Oscillospiraceae bacterium]
MIIGERPGIYAEYSVSREVYGSDDSRLTVGVAAVTAVGDGEPRRIFSRTEALQSFGVCSMSGLIKTLLLNGCGNILAAPVTEGDYASAFSRLINAGADIIICDSREASVLSALKNAVQSTEFCWGAAECDGNASACIDLARGMNFERMVLCAGTDETGGNAAAAVAAVIASERELYLNGRCLAGIGALENEWTLQETEALIAGGVTPLEYDGENVVTVRGVTTRTSTDGVPDRSLREISAVRTVTEVLKSVSNALKLRLSRAPNNALTRGAIRSQVAVELEKKLAEGRIDGYGNITAAADENDPGLCRVGFEFTAVCGLASIALTAYLKI